MAVFQLVGGHWAVLQATAWVSMLVKYSESEGVEVGITKTFDGKHPCDFCLSIAKNKQTIVGEMIFGFMVWREI